MPTDSLTSSVRVDTSSLAFLAAAGTDADRELLTRHREVLGLLAHPELDDGHREAAQGLSRRLAGKIAARVVELEGARGHSRIRRTVECTRRRRDGMTDEERRRYKRDLIYRVARHRGASKHEARRIAIDFAVRAQASRERRPGSTRSRGSRRGATSSRSSGSRGDPDLADGDPPSKKRRPCLNCAAFCESTVDYHGRRADLCPACIDRLAEGQRPVLAALERAYDSGAA